MSDRRTDSPEASGRSAAAKGLRSARRVLQRTQERLARLRAGWAARRDDANGALRVAAGSTMQFPVLSHTFVYQELMAMHQLAGSEVSLFHSQEGERDELHAAFEYLDRHRTRYASQWKLHRADYRHFQRKSPDRVDSLMRALSEGSGMSRQELEQRYELMLAFTHARRVELWGADYVHSYFFYDQALNGLVTSWLLDLPRGLTAYADHMLADWPLKLVPLHLRTAEIVVATSRRIRDELIAIGGPEAADRILVKPNGVDGRRFPSVARTAVSGRPLDVLCIARIEPKKGLLELAEAARFLLDRGRPVRIQVVGATDRGHRESSAYSEALDARIRELGLGEVVLRRGPLKQEDLPPLFGRADVFVAPFVETAEGDKDGIPTAALEALSSGLPLVGSDAGSIRETFDDGVEGFLVPQRDPRALAEALERFLAAPELARTMGQAARRRFEREFDLTVTEPRLHQRIAAAVARRRA